MYWCWFHICVLLTIIKKHKLSYPKPFANGFSHGSDYSSIFGVDLNSSIVLCTFISESAIEHGQREVSDGLELNGVFGIYILIQSLTYSLK